MTNELINEIKSHLSNFKDLNSNKNIIVTKTLNDIIIEKNSILIILNITENENLYKDLADKIKKTISSKYKEFETNVILTSEKNKSEQFSQKNNLDIKPKNIKHVIAIASGKGGVGKSTITTNIAYSLSKMDYKVAILDADIYGPSQPKMMGLENIKPTQNSEGKINTLQNHGIKCMSIGFLIEPGRPMIWRGPMIQSALQQLIQDVNWGEIDYLIVDMPPGTGDVQLTMTQKVKLSGAIIISTPQDIALLDAVKGLNMFKKVEVPIVGLIENMSYHICDKCGEKTMLFGSGGAKDVAENLKVPFLGNIPLDINIRENSDRGSPDKNNYPEEFKLISEKIIKFIQNSSS